MTADFKGPDAEILRYLWTPDIDPLFWRGERTALQSGWHAHVPFAHWIIGASRPRVLVELGTHYGVSYFAFCDAVARNQLDTSCYAVDTWKGDDQAGHYGDDVYRDVRSFHDARYTGFSQLLRCNFDEALPYLSDRSVDLLHIDGLHTYESVRHDFEAWRPKLSECGIVLFHDTNVRERDFGVWRLWEELEQQFSGFQFLHGHGLGVLAVGTQVPSPVAALCRLKDAAQVVAIRERFSFLGEHSASLNRCQNLETELAGVKAVQLRLQELLSAAEGRANATEARANATEARANATEARANATEARANAAETQNDKLSLCLSEAEIHIDQMTVELRARKEALDKSEEEARQAIRQRDQMLGSLTWRAARPLHRLAGKFPHSMRTNVYKLLDSAWRFGTHVLAKTSRKPSVPQGLPSSLPEGAGPVSERSVAAESLKTILLRPISYSENLSAVLPIGAGRRLLCVSHVLPYPPRAGNEYRIHRMLSWLAAQGWETLLVVCPLPPPVEQVTDRQIADAAAIYPNLIVCRHDGSILHRLADGGAMLEELRGKEPRSFGPQLGEVESKDSAHSELLWIMRTFCPDVLIELLLHLETKFNPDVLLAEYVFMTRPFQLLRSELFKVIDTIDLFSTKHAKVVQYGIDDNLAITSEAEAELLNRADLLIAIQNAEADDLRRLAPKRQVVKAGVDFTFLEHVPKPATHAAVLLVASGNPMNVKGLNDFLRFAWPLIKREVPDAEFRVIGSVGEAVMAEMPGVSILGRVEDLATAYVEARVVINPAVAGTGLKIKTVEALCHLRPIVVWASGADGLEPEVRALCSIADNWFEFADHVIRLLSTENDAQSLITQRAELAQNFSPDTVYSALHVALDEAAKQHLAKTEQARISGNAQQES